MTGRQRVLVLGDAFVAAHVARRLVADGHLVGAPPTSADPTAIKGVRSLPELGDQVAFAPESIVHTGLATLEETEAFLEAFRGIAGRVIALSSADVYRAYGRLMRQEPGRIEAMPVAEDAPLRRSFFVYQRMARSHDDPILRYEKRLVERSLTGQTQIQPTILRPTSIFGPGDPEHHLHNLVKRFDDGRPVVLLGSTAAEWRWSWIYVENLATAVAAALESGDAIGGCYNVADEPSPTQAEWVRAVAEAAGWEGDVVVVPDHLMPAHLIPPIDLRQDMVLDTTRIRRELHYSSTVPRREALRRTVEWARANPPDTFDSRRFDYAAEDRVLQALGA